MEEGGREEEEREERESELDTHTSQHQRILSRRTEKSKGKQNP